MEVNDVRHDSDNWVNRTPPNSANWRMKVTFMSSPMLDTETVRRFRFKWNKKFIVMTSPAYDADGAVLNACTKTVEMS